MSDISGNCCLCLSKRELFQTNLLDRFLTDYRTVIYSESENDVICKFVPPVFVNNSDASPSDNFNHYWKIKALNILQQIFPTKEYIEIELLGVDLLSDLAIEQMDYKVRIHRSNRNDTWITEINSWFISRVYYLCRPSSWNEYVEKIEKIRTTSNTLILNAISLIDTFYKKQRWSKDYWDKVYTGMATLSSLISKDLLLPVSVVDKFCLYREDMQNDNFMENNKIVIAPLLYTKYKELKKEISNGYTSVENFFKNVPEVLLKRINHNSIEGINLNLGLLNLFESLKAISKMQHEFDKYFQNYRSLEAGFNNVEVENLNVMLNVWHHVIETPPKGLQIAYDAKQKYRKAIKLVETMHNTKAIKDITIVSNDCRLFLLKEFDVNNEMIIECDYIAKAIHAYFFENADQFSNEKWLVDTIGYEFVYIPLFNDVPISVGFSILSMHIFENRLSDAFFPAVIDKSIYEYLDIDYSIVEKCILLNATFGALKMLIHQYNEIATFISGDHCLYINGINNYAQSFADEMGKQVSNLAEQIDILNILSEVEDEVIFECITAILECINSMNNLFDFVEKLEPIAEFETLVQNASGALAILQSYIVKEYENSAR